MPAERLLELISVILSGQSYRPLGAPAPFRSEHTMRELPTAHVGRLFAPNTYANTSLHIVSRDSYASTEHARIV